MSDGRMKEVVFDAFGKIDKTASAAEASTKIIATNSMIEASNSEEYLKELKESVDDYNSDVARRIPLEGAATHSAGSGDV